MIRKDTKIILPDGNLATVIRILGSIAEVAYNQGGTGYWHIDLLIEQNPPQWTTFAQALQSSARVAALYSSAPQLLCHGFTGALLRAFDGETAAFVENWNKGKALGLLSADLIAEVLQLAQQCQLPELFIAQLQGEP